MIAAAHISLAANAGSSDILQYIILSIEKNPEINWVIFVSENDSQELKFPSNVIIHNVKPEIKNSLLLQYWYRFKLPSLLNKYQAQFFLTEMPALVGKIKIPVYVFYGIGNVFNKNNFRQYYKKKFEKIVHQSSSLIVHSDAEKNKISEKLHSKIEILPQLIHEINMNEESVLSKEIQEKLDENQYFVLILNRHSKSSLIPTLKAFTIFKKWQKSSMKMIVLADKNLLENAQEKIRTYKHSSEIICIENDSFDTFSAVLSNAYLAIYLPEHFDGGKTVLEILAMNTMLISIDQNKYRKIFVDAIAYSDLHEKQITQQMSFFYKNEEEKQSLRFIGMQMAMNHTPKNVWPIMNKIFNLPEVNSLPL